jgi:hypothetical protein
MVLHYLGLTVRVTLHFPFFNALTFEPLTLQILLKDLLILIVTLDLAGSFFATEANMQVDVALFPLETTQGFGLQPAREVAPFAANVRAGQTIGGICDVLAELAEQDVEPELG